MNFTLNILGTASALPIVNRYPSAQVLDVRGRLFLIDCGEGVQIQMRRQHLSILKLDTIFITHLHGDHVFGIFGLLSTMSMLGRKTPMNIYAPTAFGKILNDFMASFGEGFNFEPVHHAVKVSAPEKIFETRNMEVLAFPLKHRIETYGYLFREKTPMRNVRKECIEKYGLTLAEIAALKRGDDVVRAPGEACEPSVENGFVRFSGSDEPAVLKSSELTYLPYKPRSFAYCSDTAPFRQLSEWIKGVDLLYHEATFPCGYESLAKATFHSTTLQAAECAAAAGVGRLLIGHYSSRFPDARFFLDEARSVFPAAELSAEGMKVDLPLVRM